MSQPIHILLIEDDEEDYMITRDIIEDIPDRHYLLDWVSSFEEGIVAIENKKYDVYLLDYRLGKEDGVELLRQVDAPSIESPFILLTGQDDIELDKEAMEAGAADFLVKGDISANVLERTIRYAIQQRKTIRQLKKSEDRLKEAQAIGKIGNFEWNISENKIYWSDELYRIFGRDPQSFELTLDNHFSQIHPDDRAMMQANLERIQKEKRGFSFGYRVVHPNQEVRYAYGSRDVELDKHGKVIRIFGTIRDVTEQKLREDELRLKDTAISTSPLPIAFADLDNKLTFVNQAFLDLWGYDDAAEILGQPTFDFGKKPKRVEEIMKSIQATGQWIGEDVARKKDGTSFNVYASTSLVRDESGMPICSLATFLDITEQKKAQATIRKEKETAQMYLDIAGSMVVVIDKDERISLLNQRGEEILGVSEEEIIKKNWFDNFVPQKERKQVRQVFDRLMDKKEKNVEYHENTVLSKNGEERLIWWHNRLLLDDEGEPQGTISSGVDITEQRKAQILNEDISKIVEESLNEIFIFEADSLKFVQINEGGRKNLGYSQSELCLMTPVDIKPEFTRKKLVALIQPLIDRKKKKLKFETIHERKNKTTYPVEVHLQYSTYGGVPAFVAVILDITERKENEERIKSYSLELEHKVKERTAELEESQQKLSEAQAIANIGHWDFIVETRELIFSKGMYKIYGLNENALISPELVEPLTHPEDRERVMAEIGNAIGNNKNVSINHRIITPAGSLKYVRSNIQAELFDENGKRTRVFGVLKDITSLKESELQLHEALNKEKELGLLKSRFVSMASHEFRTPLSSILSSAELLGMYIEAGKLDRMGRNINRIKNSVRNLTGILNDFLSLEKLETGKVELQITDIQLTDYLEELTEEIKPILRPNQQLLLQFKNINVIQADPYLLKNILINLVSNAIKYSPNGEDVTLEISITKQQLVFKIIDKGIGIPNEDQQHMFTRFFRASNVENIKGTGLGLTIVKRYLDLMGGDIGFESKYGKGSTFFFNIPMN